MTPSPSRFSRSRSVHDRSLPSESARHDHYQILLDAEVARLVHELRAFGVVRERTLARRVGCGSWQPGAFRTALREAARERKIELLPYGFVRLPREQATTRNRARNSNPGGTGPLPEFPHR